MPPRPVLFAAAGDPTGILQMVSLLLIIVVFYVLVMRPQSKRQREREQMLKRVQKGDRILTTGGLYGAVVATKGEEILVLKIADNVRVDLARAAVASVVSATPEGAAAES